MSLQGQLAGRNRRSRRVSRTGGLGRWKPRSLWAAALVAAVLSASAGRAGSVVHANLASVCEVEIHVVHGALLFEPIPGLGRDALEQLRSELRSRVEDAFTAAQIPVVDGAASSVVLELNHAWGSRPSEEVALFVELAVEQRATSFEGVPTELTHPTWTPIWRDAGLTIVDIPNVREEILEHAGYEVERLIAEIQQAKRYEMPP